MGWTVSNRSLTFQTLDLRISHAKIGAEIATYCLSNLEDTVKYFNDRRTAKKFTDWNNPIKSKIRGRQKDIHYIGNKSLQCELFSRDHVFFFFLFCVSRCFGRIRMANRFWKILQPLIISWTFERYSLMNLLLHNILVLGIYTFQCPVCFVHWLPVKETATL